MHGIWCPENRHPKLCMYSVEPSTWAQCGIGNARMRIKSLHTVATLFQIVRHRTSFISHNYMKKLFMTYFRAWTHVQCTPYSRPYRHYWPKTQFAENRMRRFRKEVGLKRTPEKWRYWSWQFLKRDRVSRRPNFWKTAKNQISHEAITMETSVIYTP